MSPRPPWAIKGELDVYSGDAGGRVFREGKPGRAAHRLFLVLLLFLF